jgi:acetolactate synthase-1/2/3 large subunit
MVVIGGRSPRKEFEKGSLQEMDHTEILRPITKWARCVPSADRITDYVEIAFRKAATGRPGPVFLEFPTDILLEVVNEADVVWPDKSETRPRPWGDPAQIRDAARALGAAKRPVVMGGSPLWWAGAAPLLKKFAETTRFPVFLNGMGRGALPPNHPYYFSYARRHALTEADVVLTFGVSLDFRMRFGKAGIPGFRLRRDKERSLIGDKRSDEGFDQADCAITAANHIQPERVAKLCAGSCKRTGSHDGKQSKHNQPFGSRRLRIVPGFEPRHIGKEKREKNRCSRGK